MTIREDKTLRAVIMAFKDTAADNTPIPVAGYYRCRLQRGGVFVAVKIEVIEERDEAGDLMADVEYRVLADGWPVSIDSVWPWCLNYPLTEQQYSDLLIGVK